MWVDLGMVTGQHDHEVRAERSDRNWPEEVVLGAAFLPVVTLSSFISAHGSLMSA